MAESSSQPATVDITQLLGCCVCACERAAAVIRAVESKRRSATTGAIEGAVLKDASDSRSYLTEADTAAQKVIMQTLRGAFPAVTIIGEEDEEEADTTEAPAAPVPVEEVTESVADLKVAESTTTNDDPDPYANLKKKKKKKKKKKEYVPDL